MGANEYVGKHRPTADRVGTAEALSRGLGSGLRDYEARARGYHYLPRHATPEVWNAAVIGMTR